MRRAALVLVIIGALNWLSVGFFQFDVVAALFGGSSSTFSRIIYSLVGLSGIYLIPFTYSSTEVHNR